MLNETLGEGPRRIFDVVSVGVAVGAVTDLLPSIAALLTVVYTAIQIWDSRCANRLRHRLRVRARLRARDADRG